MRRIEWLKTGLTVLYFLGSWLSGAAQGPGFELTGIGSAPVPVTTEKMTNLIFPEAVQIGVKVSRNVVVQKVRGVENVIEVLARRRGFPATNLSVYGKDGRLYSFVLHYAVDSEVLNFRVVAGGDGGGKGLTVARGSGGGKELKEGAAVMLEGLPVDMTRLLADAAELAGRRGFLHRRVEVSGVGLRLAGVYLRDSLEWLVLEVTNHTAIPFRLGYARYFVEDRGRVKRRAVQEWGLTPVMDGMASGVGGGQRECRALGFTPFTVGRDKRLVVELAGADGRTVRLGVKAKLLLKAKAL